MLFLAGGGVHDDIGQQKLIINGMFILYQCFAAVMLWYEFLVLCNSNLSTVQSFKLNIAITVISNLFGTVLELIF